MANSPAAAVRRLAVRFPFDRKEVVDEVPWATPSDVQKAIAAAQAVFDDTRRRTGHERATLLERVAAGIEARKAALARTICMEAGKPITLARAEVERALSTFTFAAAEARGEHGEWLNLDGAPLGRGRTALVRRAPMGPVAAITPFNFPLNLVAHKVAPALAVGAPVVVKPALETPLAALALAAIITEAGAWPGEVQVLVADNEVAAPLVDDARLPVLSFTGSAEAGWALAARAVRKRVTLELGGNAAVIVEPDADLDLAASRVVSAAFAYAGQVCIKAQRVFVASSVAAEFERRLLAATRTGARAGDPRDEGVLVPPLIRGRDADRVAAWIEEARAGGARVLLGGGRQGDLIEPTWLADVPHDAKVWRQEVFGPVATLEPYERFEDAIALANESDYGLQASVFSRDVRRVLGAFAELQVGAVIHDDAPTFRVDQMPYGGVKASGRGREGARAAMLEMTEPRMLVLRQG